MTRSFVVCLLLLLLVLPCTPARAAKPLNTPEYKSLVFKGELLSREIAKTTGIALNPILCMSALGAYHYFSTEPAARPTLPWHAQPLFWGSLSFVLLLIFLKDSGKIVLPKILMVPLDAAETLIEKKATALLALPLLFSLVYNGEFEQLRQVSQQAMLFFAPVSQALAAPDVAGSAVAGPASTLLTLAVVYVLFAVVWVVSHAINMLILLSPFNMVDMLLASLRNSLAALVLGLSGTTFGLGLALVTVALCLWLFPRALRLVFFGTITAYDILVYRLFGRQPDPVGPDQGVRGFTSCVIGTAPPLTPALLRQQDGRLLVTLRPGVFRARQTIVPEPAPAQCELQPGLLSPVIVARATDQNEEIQLFRLLPRHGRHLRQVGQALAIPVAADTSLAAVLGGWLQWVVSLLRKPCRIETEVAAP